MQKQTEKYLDAIYAANVVQSSISGKIITADGETYELSDADIVPGSLEKNNKCVNGSSFEFGAVYQGELNVTLRKAFDRYRLMGGSITFAEHRMLQDGTMEDVNVGKFYIASAERSKKLTTIKAVDSMRNLDIDITDDIVGTPYELLATLSDQCGVCLAQTKEYLTALPNGQQILTVSADTTETYRDLAAYLGMVTGTFATINAQDQLELRIYALENSINVPAAKRASGSTVIADYVTYYKGIRARFIAQENYAPYEYIDDTVADGLILDLGDIPIVKGMPELKNAMLQILFDRVVKWIRYIPAEFTLVTSDAALELGDRIGIAGEDADTYITSYSWIYHGSEKIKGVGDNPRLKAYGDKTSRQMASLEEKVSTKDIITHSYTNISPYTLQEKEKTIISINYATVTNAHPVFIATIPFTVDRDGDVTFKYYLDEVLMPEDTVRQYVPRGDHIVTLSNNLTAKKDTRHTLSVKASTGYMESDARQQAAKITAFERYITTGKYTAQAIDTTIPKATIAKNSIRAVLYAQGMAGTDEWDGTINISEYVTPMDLPRMQLSGFTASAVLADVPREDKAITESIAAWGLLHLPIVGLEVSVTADTQEDNPDKTIEESEDETT